MLMLLQDHICHICSASFYEEWRLADHIDEEHVKEMRYHALFDIGSQVTLVSIIFLAKQVYL